MNCPKCGILLGEGDKFCKNCGASVASVEQQPVNSINPAVPQPVSTQPVNTLSQPKPAYNGYYGAPNANNANSSNKILLIIIGLLVVAIIVAGVIVIPKLTEKTPVPTNSNTNQGTNTVTPVSTGTKVDYEGYTFEVPSDVKYEIYQGSLLLSDDSTWLVELAFSDGNFDLFKTKLTEIQQEFQNRGITAKNLTVKTYGGTEMLTVELYQGGENMLMCYAKLTSSKTIVFAVYGKNYTTITYAPLETMGKMIKNIKPGNSTSSFTNKAKFNNNIDLNALTAE